MAKTTYDIPPCTAQGCGEYAEGMSPHGELLCGDHYEKWYPSWVYREADDRWQADDDYDY